MLFEEAEKNCQHNVPMCNVEGITPTLKSISRMAPASDQGALCKNFWVRKLSDLMTVRKEETRMIFFAEVKVFSKALSVRHHCDQNELNYRKHQ